MVTKPISTKFAMRIMAQVEKQRGAFLTALLILYFMANAGVAALYFLFGALLTDLLPAISSWTFYVFGVLALLNVLFIIFLFKWKKWAFFAICGNSGIAFVTNIAIGVGITSIIGLLGIIILYLALRSKWSYLE